MHQIKKIDLTSVALYSFIMTFVLILLISLPFGIVFTLLSEFIPDTSPFEGQGFPFANLGILVFFIAALAYAILVTIMNTILALVYNLISSKLGGIKIAIEKVEEKGIDNTKYETLDDL